MKNKSPEACQAVVDAYTLGETRFIHPSNESFKDLLGEVATVLERNPDIRTLAVDMEQVTEINEQILEKLNEIHMKMGSEVKQGVFLLDVQESVSQRIDQKGYGLKFPQVPSRV